MKELWHHSEESLTTFIIAVAVIVTIGPMIIPVQLLDFFRTDLFAVLVLGIVVWYGRECNQNAMLVMTGIIILYLFLSTHAGNEREFFCPMNPFNKTTETAAPVDWTNESPSSEPPPQRCNYTSHPSLETAEDTATLVPPCEWLGSAEASGDVPTENENVEAYEWGNSSTGGADLNASFN